MTMKLPVLLLSLALTAAATAGKPSIILILCDDMGYSDLGCYGGEIHTPNIDRMAAEGLRFRQFYNNSKCTTTRASLLTGCYPFRSGKGGHQLLDGQTLTLASALKPVGYRTILTGKWHLESDGPNAWGFDESYGLLDGCSDSFEPTIRGRKFGHNGAPVRDFPDDYYVTDAYTDHAIDQIRKSVAAGEPYFLHLAYQAPHWPLHAKPEDHARYKGRYAGGWEEMRAQRHKRMIELGVIPPDTRLSAVDPDAKPWTGSPNDQLTMELHAAMIDSMDQNIGRLLACLDETKTADNTIVVFLSDNGASAESPITPPVGNPEPGAKGSYLSCGPSWANAQSTPFRKYKKFGHEGGMRTPCIIRWPAKISTGRWTDAVAHIIDFQPTFMEAAGLSPTDGIPAGKRPLEGESFISLLQGGDFLREKPVYFEWAGNRAVREGDWKACYMRQSGQWELFDLSSDPTEMNDLAATHPEKLEGMVRAWTRWAGTHGVRAPGTR